MKKIENIIELLLDENIDENILFCEDDNIQYTYKTAIEKIKNIACFLHSKQIKNKPILVRAERNSNTLVALLGIALSNNNFVPVNPEYSADKVQSIIDSSNIKHQICFEKSDDMFGLEQFGFDEMTGFESSEEVLLKLKNDFCLDNEIYTIYTSGSTGHPKGVVKTHKNVIAFVQNFVDTFNFPKNMKIANQSPLFFDASMKDVFLSIATNSTLYFPNKTLFAMPLKIVEYLNEKQIDYICWVPSALTIIARLNTFKYVIPKHLKYVLFVGEVFLPKYLNMWKETLPNVMFVNTYGSTELAGVCLYKVIDEILPEDKPIPLGIPLKNNQVFLQDGEIVVRSDQIAKCYTNDEIKNREVFEVKNGEVFLKTGDFAYNNEKGEIVFSTRKDFQIKHMGYRIELQEIEISISSLNLISNCAVLYDAEKDKLVAFVSLDGDAVKNEIVIEDLENCEKNNEKLQIFSEKIKKEAIKLIFGQLKNKLPAYMVPNKIEVLDEIPLNANGKINRTELKGRLNI